MGFFAPDIKNQRREKRPNALSRMRRGPLKNSGSDEKVANKNPARFFSESNKTGGGGLFMILTFYLPPRFDALSGLTLAFLATAFADT